MTPTAAESSWEIPEVPSSLTVWRPLGSFFEGVHATDVVLVEPRIAAVRTDWERAMIQGAGRVRVKRVGAPGIGVMRDDSSKPKRR